MSAPLAADEGVSPLPVFTLERLYVCPPSVHLSVRLSIYPSTPLSTKILIPRLLKNY